MNPTIDTIAASIENCMLAWAEYGERVRGKPFTDLNTFLAGYIAGLRANVVLAEKAKPAPAPLPPVGAPPILSLPEAVEVEPKSPFKRPLHAGQGDVSPADAED